MMPSTFDEQTYRKRRAKTKRKMFLQVLYASARSTYKNRSSVREDTSIAYASKYATSKASLNEALISAHSADNKDLRS